MSSTGYATTILVLHPPDVAPYPFLNRLVSSSGDPGPSSSKLAAAAPATALDEEQLVPWNIDNKYYTALVHLRPVALDSPEALRETKEDVVVYLFQEPPSSLPPEVGKVMSIPRDIALAVRLAPSQDEGDGEVPSRALPDIVEEMFDELGMELFDEAAPADDDDERPTPVLDRIRETLMTHMWPNMMMKPRAAPSAASASFDDTLDGDDLKGEEEHASFPVTFGVAPLTAPAADAQEDDNGEAFPDLETIKAALRAVRLAEGVDGEEDDDEWGEDFGPGEEEYARLDEWLDEDEPDFETFIGVPGGTDVVDAPPDESQPEPEAGPSRPSPRALAVEDKDEGFEDDFSGFHSAPRAEIPLDPTPMLLHLQSVRSEISALPEDERRVRAGKEVIGVMRQLGLDMTDLGDLVDMDELDALAQAEEEFDDLRDFELELADATGEARQTGRRSRLEDLDRIL